MEKPACRYAWYHCLWGKRDARRGRPDCDDLIWVYLLEDIGTRLPRGEAAPGELLRFGTVYPVPFDERG
jgi:hypothetical protein